MARTYRTEAVVLRSFRLGEADRVLHVYTADRGRVGAVAKGVRRTKSRFGGRLEPLSHVELMLHQGSGELQTRHRRRPARVASRGARGSLPARRRPDRRRGDAEALHRAGGERARVHRADALPRPARRDPVARAVAAGARSARALVPAEAALALRLHAAPRRLRRVRGGGGARRLRARRRRRRLPRLRWRVDRALARRAARDHDARRDADGRRATPRASPTAAPARRWRS